MSARSLTLSRRAWWRIAAVPVGVGAVIAVVAATSASSASASYRTAAVTTGDVTQTLTQTGSIASASQYDLAFQVGGTVADVAVAVGDAVEAGQVVATLDTDALDDAVATAEEALADAEEALAEDLEAQADATSSSTAESASYSSGDASGEVVVTAALYVAGTASATTVADPGSPDDASNGDVEAARAALIAAQQALLAQYDAAQALLAQAQQASVDAQQVCAAFAAASDDEATADDLTDDATDGADEADADEAVADEATGDDGDTGTDPAAALAACQEATAAALAASQESIDAQATLMELAAAVDEAVATFQAAVAAASSTGDGGDAGNGDQGTAPGDTGDAGSGDQGVAPGAGGDSSASGDAQAPSGDDSTSGDDASGANAQGGMGDSSATEESSVPSAADILADKADIAAAEAALAVARQEVEHATLTAPVAGTVIAVTMAADGSVSAGDTSTAITVVADNSYLVELSVGLTEAQLLAVGQEAALTLTATGETVDGTVSSVSSVNSGNQWSQSYAVTIAIPDPGFEIRIGAATRMQITVGAATGVLVVPTSAVTDAAGAATVQVVGDDGVATEASIVTGAVGAVYTEVVSGLEKDDEVVLADLTQPLTADESSSDSSGGLLSGLDSDESDADTGTMPGGGPQGGMAPGGTDGGGMAPGGMRG